MGEKGFAAIQVWDARSAEEMALSQSPDAILLNSDLPPLGGLVFCYKLRSEPETARVPIVMLGRAENGPDKLAALEVGADDLFHWPDDEKYVAARVRALIRRARISTESRQTFQVGELTLDLPSRRLTHAGRPIDVSFTEFRILHLLASNPDRVYSRSEIAASIGSPDGEILDRTIDAHIKGIRRKLGPTANGFVETVRGFGYRLRPARR